MESVFVLVSLGLFAATILTAITIVRDILPRLGKQEQEYFRGWLHNWGTVRFGRAFRKAWDEHVQVFPKSRKRLLFGAFLLGMFLSMMAPGLWVALAPR
jgi:hypothetical protein